MVELDTSSKTALGKQTQLRDDELVDLPSNWSQYCQWVKHCWRTYFTRCEIHGGKLANEDCQQHRRQAMIKELE